MRSLTSTLLAAQKEATRTPYVRVEAKNRIAGVVRLDWERLYTGTEDDYFHALTIPGDGSLIRARITPAVDGRKLYRQRVPNPGPSSDFSNWTDTNQYNCIIAAAASLGAEVSIFWINSSREIRRIKSTDYGLNWGNPELIDYSPSTAINGLAAVYQPNGDLAIFFADQATLYVKKYLSGSWQSKVAWDKTTGNLSGVAAVYDADWNLVITGKDAADNFKLWSLIYGDGGDVTSGTWSALKEFASAPSDGNFEYGRAFMDKPDVYRCFYIEKFTGTEAYNRPFWSHSVPEASFLGSLWHEPIPFEHSSEYGMAIAHHGDYGWLSTPYGVWRARLIEESIDLTADVLSLSQEAEESQGKLTLELRNDDGGYASLPSPLAPGCQLEVSPGYVTTKAIETLRPVAAGDETNITYQFPATGAHWDKVDEAVADDADYIGENSVWPYKRDLYNLPALSASVSSISKVTVYVRARCSQATGDRASLKIAIKTGGIVYEDSERTLTWTFSNYSGEWANNPNTGLAWTEADINALQIGVALQAPTTSNPGGEWSRVSQVYVEIEHGGGNEASPGQTFALEAYEYTSSGGKASLFLYAEDGWEEMNVWRARHQFRWNKASSEMSVKDILAFVLARVGLKFEVKSQSSVITGYYPDFSLHPSNQGGSVIDRLLSFVPDVLFVEGNKAYIVNPLTADSSVYSYGASHPILEGHYRNGAWELNRVQVEGYNPAGGGKIVKDTFAWSQLSRLYDRLSQLEDRNIDSVTKAEQRGEAYLREAEIASAAGTIRIPVNCGQQLYDVIDITDSRAGLSAEKKRVLGLTLIYNPNRSQYEQRLSLGAV